MPEATIHDLSYENVALVNYGQGATAGKQVVVLDLANSNASRIAVTLPAAALAQPIGVVVDSTKLDPTGAVVVGAGVNVRHWGAALCVAAGAIAVGDHVSVADTAGRVQTQARAVAGAQPQPVVGIARSATSALGQTVDVLLAIGTTF